MILLARASITLALSLPAMIAWHRTDRLWPLRWLRYAAPTFTMLNALVDFATEGFESLINLAIGLFALAVISYRLEVRTAERADEHRPSPVSSSIDAWASAGLALGQSLTLCCCERAESEPVTARAALACANSSSLKHASAGQGPNAQDLRRRDPPRPQFTQPMADIGISTAHNASKIHNPIMTLLFPVVWCPFRRPLCRLDNSYVASVVLRQC